MLPCDVAMLTIQLLDNLTFLFRFYNHQNNVLPNICYIGNKHILCCYILLCHHCSMRISVFFGNGNNECPFTSFFFFTIPLPDCYCMNFCYFPTFCSLPYVFSCKTFP